VSDGYMPLWNRGLLLHVLTAFTYYFTSTKAFNPFPPKDLGGSKFGVWITVA